MERKDKPVKSLKWQMMGIVLICWLAPVALILAVMGWYMVDSLGTRTADSLNEQLTINVRMCADRLDSAITASRTASTDPTIKSGWTAYQRDGLYPPLYRAAHAFLDGQYRTDRRFRFAAFWFHQTPDTLRLGVFNPSVGARYEQLIAFWGEDYQAAAALAAGLDTRIGFLVCRDELYLVRNVMSSSFTPIGTLVLCLNRDYYFENLSALPWVREATVYLDGLALPLSGQPLPPPDELERPGVIRLSDLEESCLAAGAAQREYDLSASVRLDLSSFLSQFTGYCYLLGGMLFLLVPLLLFVLSFFRKRVSDPVKAMMEGAGEIEAGKLGHQLDYQANSQEFQYLTDSFNQMSGRLKGQFDRIYQEELALRDARIKALQSHINPHFLNNTLEIINWEARMNGDAKVSKMIEALSTLLDAAIARDKRPEVSLAEEMGYVNAYLYIIDQRFGKRLTVEREMAEDTMGQMVPRLILQPVIENAVEHGIGPGGTGSIMLRSRMRNGLLLIEVENDGVLTPEDEMHIRTLLAPDYDASRESSRNLGIANVNQRLHILYGGPSGLQIGLLHGRVTARLTIQPRKES